MRGNIPSVASLLCNNCRKILDIYLYIPFCTPARTFVTFREVLLAVFEILMQRHLYDKKQKTQYIRFVQKQVQSKLSFSKKFLIKMLRGKHNIWHTARSLIILPKKDRISFS